MKTRTPKQRREITKRESEVLTAVVMKSTLFWDITLCYFQTGFLLGLFFDPEDGGDMFLPKRRLIFNGLHGVISQKIVLFK
jgi:hypothetical protein